MVMSGSRTLRQQGPRIRIIAQFRWQFVVQPFVPLALAMSVGLTFGVQPGPAGNADVLGARLNVPDRGWHLGPRAE